MTSTTIPLAFAEIAQKETVAGAAARLDEMLRWGTYPEIWLAGGERARREALRRIAFGRRGAHDPRLAKRGRRR